MQKKLLNLLIKANLNEKKSLDTLIDEFIQTQTNLAKGQLEDFLSSLFVYINRNYDKVPKDELLNIIESKLQDLNIQFDTKDIDEVYASIATATSVGTTKVVFDKIDTKAINAMRNGFFWASDKYNNDTQNLLKDMIEETFKGNIPRANLSSALKDAFQGIIDKDENYFKLVADNIISQSQNISRLNQGLKYDVKYFKVRARVDAKTSDFCRSVNNKIIPSEHLKTQLNNILDATNIDDKKEAAPWQSKGLYDILPKNVGIPPYHGRCRTQIEPYWLKKDDILDEFDRLIKPLDKEINAKILNKDDHLKATKYKNPTEMLKATIQNVAKEGAHINDESKKVIFGQNGCIAIINNKRICETCFKPKKGIDYYERNAITKYNSMKKKGVKKWLEKLLLKF